MDRHWVEGDLSSVKKRGVIASLDISYWHIEALWWRQTIIYYVFVSTVKTNSLNKRFSIKMTQSIELHENCHCLIKYQPICPDCMNKLKFSLNILIAYK